MKGKGPAHRIETGRLVLRCFFPEDAGTFRALLDASDQHLRPWIPWMKNEPMSLADTQERLRGFRGCFERGEDFRYPIFRADDDVMIGLTGLHPRIGPGALETGYMLGREHGGRGYALEAAGAMVKLAFELHGVERVEIRCDPDNAPSYAVAEKLGFTHETTLPRHAENSEGELRDLMVWVLHASQYVVAPLASMQVRAFDATGARLL